MAVRVTAKTALGISPEELEGTKVPVPQKLIVLLRPSRPANATPDDPIPSTTGRPDGAMLENLRQSHFAEN